MRRAAVAGAFYPGRPQALEEDIQGMLDASPAAEPETEVVAAVAPHAGYVYSGQVAALTHKAMQNTAFDTIVIIGHDSYRGAVAYVSTVDAYDTPLGQVEVDGDMVAKLLAYHPGIKGDTAMHAREHTVEVHLPFLQTMKRTCKIVPILFGDPLAENCNILSRAIIEAAGDKKVFVLASTDLSHYPTYDDASRVDRATLKSLEPLDIETLFAQLTKSEKGAPAGLQTAMCSRGGVGTAILFARSLGADHARILKYANSGDAPVGSRDRVVGYGAALMLRPRKTPPPK